MARDERESEDAREEGGENSGSRETERGKPLSIRDVAPSSPARARPDERRAGEESAGDEGPGSEPEEEDDRRPTPVRVAMDTPPPGDSRPTEALPSRRFQLGDEEWIVRITGRTVTGTRPDPGAHLMELTFYRAPEPDEPVRELLTVERDLDLFYDEDLGELLERSRPSRRDEET